MNISIDKEFVNEAKYCRFLEELKIKIPEINLTYSKSFSTDLSITFMISISNTAIFDIDCIIKKIYSFN